MNKKSIEIYDPYKALTTNLYQVISDDCNDKIIKLKKERRAARRDKKRDISKNNKLKMANIV